LAPEADPGNNVPLHICDQIATASDITKSSDAMKQSVLGAISMREEQERERDQAFAEATLVAEQAAADLKAKQAAQAAAPKSESIERIAYRASLRKVCTSFADSFSKWESQIEVVNAELEAMVGGENEVEQKKTLREEKANCESSLDPVRVFMKKFEDEGNKVGNDSSLGGDALHKHHVGHAEAVKNFNTTNTEVQAIKKVITDYRTWAAQWKKSTKDLETASAKGKLIAATSKTSKAAEVSNLGQTLLDRLLDGKAFQTSGMKWVVQADLLDEGASTGTSPIFIPGAR